MRVRLLGTAAGGGFPQWNCACPNCDGVRRGIVRASPRRECCVAVSADGRCWFLVNAPLDVRAQIESFPPLWPAGNVRGSGVEGILLTGADLDQVLGLFALREGSRLTVHVTAGVRNTLAAGLSLPSALEPYARIDWREPPSVLTPLPTHEGMPSGLRYAAFHLPGRPPRYLREWAGRSAGDCIGYVLVDEATGGRLVIAPSVSALDSAILARLRECDVLFIDGAFWSEDEMPRLEAGTLRASDMGHVPVGGPDGSLAVIAPLPVRRKVYVHVNNTNPMLIEDSPERRLVESAGVEVGWDGMEIEL